MPNVSTPRQRSERVIVNAPLSLAGSSQRIWRLRRGSEPVKWALTPLVVLLVLAAWTLVVGWYVVAFGLLWFLLIPYRLLRRGARKRKMEALRHRETLAALERRGGNRG